MRTRAAHRGAHWEDSHVLPGSIGPVEYGSWDFAFYSFFNFLDYKMIFGNLFNLKGGILWYQVQVISSSSITNYRVIIYTCLYVPISAPVIIYNMPIWLEGWFTPFLLLEFSNLGPMYLRLASDKLVRFWQPFFKANSGWKWQSHLSFLLTQHMRAVTKHNGGGDSPLIMQIFHLLNLLKPNPVNSQRCPTPPGQILPYHHPTLGGSVFGSVARMWSSPLGGTKRVPSPGGATLIHFSCHQGALWAGRAVTWWSIRHHHVTTEGWSPVG